VVKLSKGLSNMVSIISRRYLAHVQFAVYMAVSFIKFLPISLVLYSIIVYTVLCFVCFCLIFVNFVFLLRCAQGVGGEA
jgi:hypothetical protein